MGMGMIRNLHRKSSHKIFGFDVNPSALRTLQSEQIPTFSDLSKEDLKDLVAVVTMLPQAKHVESFYDSEVGRGVLEGAGKGTLLIDCSTVGPVEAARLHSKFGEAGMEYVDAPVSGGTLGANNGTLTFMVGAKDPQVFERTKEVLGPMGLNFFDFKKPAMGQVAKICNNLVLGIQMCGVSEAMTLGEQFGVDLKILSEAMSKSTAGCWAVSANNPAPGVLPTSASSRNYEGGFAVSLMEKDLDLALKVSQTKGLDLTLGKSAHSKYRPLIGTESENKDFGIVINSYKPKK